jgi:glycosyltransferase involved in cell wall biosynthesis
MKIALAHFRVGETDGVSLEMEKWKNVFENMGHQVIFISGTSDYGDFYIKEMDLHRDAFKKWERNSYKSIDDYENEESFSQEIRSVAKEIETALDEIYEKERFDIIIPNNIFSLGTGIPVAIGFYNFIEKHHLISINHNHDFYWERSHMNHPTCDFVKKALEKYYPPIGDNYQQVVINKIAQAELKKRKGCDSVVVPNVFDFHSQEWTIDDYNRDLREQLGIGERDIVFLQATRVATRKAIELGIETIGEIKKRKQQLIGPLYDGREFTDKDQILLFMPGLIETDSDYITFLKKLAAEEGVKIIWAEHLFGAKRSHRDVKKYSLWDAYVIADFITYPSILEGWGNQYLEGLFAKKPMIIFEYPVFKTDIMPFGFKNVSLGHTFTQRDDNESDYVSVERKKLEDAATKTIEILKSEELYYDMVNINFKIAREKLSFNALGRTLSKIIKKATKYTDGAGFPGKT